MKVKAHHVIQSVRPGSAHATRSSNRKHDATRQLHKQLINKRLAAKSIATSKGGKTDADQDPFDMVLTTYRPGSPDTHQTEAERVRMAARNELLRDSLHAESPNLTVKKRPSKLPGLRARGTDHIVHVLSKRNAKAPPPSPREPQTAINAGTPADGGKEKMDKANEGTVIPKRLVIVSPEKPKRKRLSAHTSSSHSDSLNKLHEHMEAFHKGLALDDFDIMGTIGKGGFGKVMLVRRKEDEKEYAMKVMDKHHVVETGCVERVIAEKHILEHVHHPFMVKLHGAFHTADQLMLILCYAPGGDLEHHLREKKRFDPISALFYMCEIILAMGHLHENDIVFRDLKPANILLNSDGHIMLTDFGLAKDIGGSFQHRTKTVCGTPEYLAPEIIKGEAYDGSVDWWTLGIIFYEMLVGRTPFAPKKGERRSMRSSFLKILVAPIEYPSRLNVPMAARALIDRLLCRDAKERLGSHNDVSGVKRHFIFCDVNWENVKAKKLKPPFIPKRIDTKIDTEDKAVSFRRAKEINAAKGSPAIIHEEDDRSRAELKQIDEAYNDNTFHVTTTSEKKPLISAQERRRSEPRLLNKGSS